MTLTDNSIGDFDFLALTGNPVPPVETVSIDQRPAIDGTRITRDGNRGTPFTMMSRAMP